MTLRWKTRWALLLCVAAVSFGFIFVALPAMAGHEALQGDDIGAGLLGAAILFYVMLVIAAYVYMSLCLMLIANKTGTPNGWMAWVPILNIVLMVLIARRPVWWLLLFLIPLVNIVFAVIVWMGIAEARGKPNGWGILMIVPVVNLVVPGYLAFSD